jgi:hypothetical protein
MMKLRNLLQKALSKHFHLLIMSGNARLMSLFTNSGIYWRCAVRLLSVCDIFRVSDFSGWS